MLVTRVLAQVLLVLQLTSLGYSQAPKVNARVTGWAEDIDFLLAQIGKQHYIYKSKPLLERLVNGAGVLKTRIPRYSDERMLAELQRLISLVGDGHSYVLPWGAEHVRSTFLPVR